jgi:hypothetical protein
VLNKQVEEATGGAISKKMMMTFLCCGVALAVGLAMIRVLSGISIWYFLVPVYVAALVLPFFVPEFFTGIAFDSGGVASGPMTATFMLPLAVGAATSLGSDVFTDAYGLVAFVAMTPLLAIQLMGIIYKIKTTKKQKLFSVAIAKSTDSIVYDDIIEFETQHNQTLIDEDDVATSDNQTIEDEFALDFNQTRVKEDSPLHCNQTRVEEDSAILASSLPMEEFANNTKGNTSGDNNTNINTENTNCNNTSADNIPNNSSDNNGENNADKITESNPDNETSKENK